MKTKALAILILLATPYYGLSAQQALETTINPAYYGHAETVQGGDVEDTVNANMVKQEANNSDLYNQAATKWIVDIAYTTDNTFVAHGGQLYICKEGHLSSATTEPDVGATWETGWTLFSGYSQTGAEIKAAYEAEADTNAYTDTDAAKVANVPADTTTELAGKQADLDIPSQAEAEAGSATTERVWTPQRVAQAIAALAPGGVDEIVYLADCSGVTNGFCIDTDDGALYFYDGDSVEAVSGVGDVVGPASATDNAFARYDSTTGKLIQGGQTTEDDSGNVIIKGTLTVDGINSSADNGDHYGDVTNTVAITAPFDEGNYSYSTVSGRMHLADGSDYDGFLLEDTDIDVIVQAYDTDTAKTDMAETLSAAWDLGTPSAIALTNASGFPSIVMLDSEVTKEIGWALFDAETVTAIADPLFGAVIPASMNGMELIDVTCSITGNITGATSGDTTVIINRIRAGTEAVMTSTGVTIAYNAWSASDETVNTANDDVVTGDVIMAEVTGIVAGTAHTGLSCTTLFQ